MWRVGTIVSLAILLQGCGSFWELVLTDQEKQRLRHAASTAAACQLSRTLQAPMLHENLYTWNQGWCEPVPLQNEHTFKQVAGTSPLYSDLFCRNPIAFKQTPYYEFCSEYTSPERLGQEAIPNPVWTLNPAQRFRLPLLRHRWSYQPFMLRTHYKHVPVGDQITYSPLTRPLHIRRGSGECSLEMRVYKQSPQMTGLKPLLIFHSGGWRKRGYHLLALESRISEFTEQGFMVFVPMNRMSGTGRVAPECGQANWRDLMDDAESALSWVVEHAPGYGSDGSKPRVMGQGIGGMQVGWLMVDQPDAVERVLLLYPMLDSGALIQAFNEQRWSHPKSVDALQLLLNQPTLDGAQLDSEVVRLTSFTRRVNDESRDYPPLRILHGSQDQRILPQQSIAMCRAYGGHISDDDAGGESGLYQCGNQGTLQLLAGADYHLDYCLEGIECPSGDMDSRLEVRNALEDATHWLASGDTE